MNGPRLSASTALALALVVMAGTVALCVMAVLSLIRPAAAQTIMSAARPPASSPAAVTRPGASASVQRATRASATTTSAAGSTEQDAFNAGKALGASMAQQSAGDVRSGQAETATVGSVVQGYTSSPPEAGLYRSRNISGAGSTLAANCASTPNDPACAAITVATTTRPRGGLTAADPALAGAAAADNPAGVLGNIASTYNACAVGGTMTAAARYERKACELATTAWTDNGCTKTLSVHPKETSSCVPGSVLATRRIVRGGADSMEVTAYCDPRSGSRVRITAKAEGSHGACAGPVDTVVDLSQPSPAPGGVPFRFGTVIPDWSRACRPMAVMWEGPGCQGGSCSLNVHFVSDPGVQGVYSCADPNLVAGNQVIVGPDVEPLSPALCYQAYPSIDEAGGAPGGYGWYMDSYAFWGAVAPATQTGWTWAAGEHFVAPMSFVEPHIIPASGDQWANTCSAMEARTPNLAADGVNNLQGPAAALLADAGTDQCVRTSSTCTDGPSTHTINGVEVTRACWSWRNTFACTRIAAGSSCADPAMRTCSQVDGAQCSETDGQGHCLRAAMQFDCKVADATFSPAVNCGASTFCAGGSCWDSSYAPNDRFAYAIAQMEAHAEAGKDFDTTALEIFKGRDSRCHKDTFGLDDCCKGGALFQHCSAEEQQLIQSKAQGRCHEVGTYCSASSLFGCREHTTTHCCFSSLLARLVQEQGRSQIARGWGSPQSPSCQGFTPSELAQLDWSRFDLSEFYAQISPSLPNAANPINGATSKQPACYWGQGRC